MFVTKGQRLAPKCQHQPPRKDWEKVDGVGAINSSIKSERPRVRDDSNAASSSVPPWRVNQLQAPRFVGNRVRWAQTGVYGNREAVTWAIIGTMWAGT